MTKNLLALGFAFAFVGCAAEIAESETATSSSEEALVGSRTQCRSNEDCFDDEFCNFPSRSMCGVSRALWTAYCAPRPSACTRDYRPVCGCDNETYSNACSANAAGVTVAEQGACE